MKKRGDPSLGTSESFDHSMARERFPAALSRALQDLASRTVENWPGRDWSQGEDDGVPTQERAEQLLLFCAHDLLKARCVVGTELEGQLPGFAEDEGAVKDRLTRIAKAVKDIRCLNETVALQVAYSSFTRRKNIDDFRDAIHLSFLHRRWLKGFGTELHEFEDIRLFHYLPDLLLQFESLVRDQIKPAHKVRFGNREDAPAKYELLRLAKGHAQKPPYTLVSRFMHAFASYKGIQVHGRKGDPFGTDALRQFARRERI